MKKNLLVTIFLIVSGFSMYAQSILNASEGYVTETILSDYSNLSVFDVNGFNLYASDGSKIYHFDLATDELLDTYVLPDYMTGTYTYPSFLKISPDIETLWYGITSGPNGDEIFSYNIENSTWSEGYSLLCNFDMEFIGEHILVSGLNSTSWSDPNCISMLDVSGNDNHRKIIDVGGYSAGLGIDDEGNVYYATSGVGSEKLYRWDMETVINVINDSSAEILTLDDATILSSIPAGAYDTDVDEAGNVFFDFSDYATGVKNVVMWNGNEGDNENFEILAYSNDPAVSLTLVNSKGNFMNGGKDNGIIAGAWGLPLTLLYKEINLIAPSDLVATTEGISSISLSWTAVETALSYNIYQGEELLTNVSVTSYIVEGLEYDTEYCFAVTAVHDEIESEKSEEACAKTAGESITEYEMNFRLYPNPTDGIVYIESEANVEYVEIYNMMGQKIASQKLQSSSVDLSSYPSGFYTLLLEVNGNKVPMRIVLR